MQTRNVIGIRIRILIVIPISHMLIKLASLESLGEQLCTLSLSLPPSFPLSLCLAKGLLTDGLTCLSINTRGRMTVDSGGGPRMFEVVCVACGMAVRVCVLKGGEGGWCGPPRGFKHANAVGDILKFSFPKQQILVFFAPPPSPFSHS